ncbi:hypothetical protein ONZ45_g15171 [Pleurotus djamor]|nr:hypothetical protein ONZ45_g15171 [Pleurotus djamor]
MMFGKELFRPHRNASRGSNNGEIGAPELSRPVATLAESLTRAMSAIYSIHVAMNQSYKEKSSEVAQFVNAKEELRQKWEAIASFLQRSLGYIRDYVQLCQSIQNQGNLRDSMATASAIVHYAYQIQIELSKLRPSYHSSIETFLLASSNVHVKNHFFNQKRGYDLDVGPQAGSSFTAAAQSHHRVSLPDSTTTAKTALEDSEKALQDITSFWNEHYVFLENLAKSIQTLHSLLKGGYFNNELAQWKTYHEALLQSIFSISSSSDAMTVVPMFKMSRWGRALGFLPKRRGSFD